MCCLCRKCVWFTWLLFFVFKAVHFHTISFCLCIFPMLTCCVLFAFHNLLCLKCVWYIVFWELFFVFNFHRHPIQAIIMQSTNDGRGLQEAIIMRISLCLLKMCVFCWLVCWGSTFWCFPQDAIRIHFGNSYWHAKACLDCGMCI